MTPLRPITTLVLGLILAAGGPACARQPVADPVPPEALVWMVLHDLNGLYLDRDDPTNRPPLLTAPPQGLIRAVDVSRDGRPDWLIDYAAAGEARYCGTGGCLKTLYVSDGDAGLARAFDTQALGFEISDQDGASVVEAWVHHLFCTPDNHDCRYRFVWDAEARRLMAVGSTSERPTGERAFQPLPVDEDDGR